MAICSTLAEIRVNCVKVGLLAMLVKEWQGVNLITNLSVLECPSGRFWKTGWKLEENSNLSNSYFQWIAHIRQTIEECDFMEKLKSGDRTFRNSNNHRQTCEDNVTMWRSKWRFNFYYSRPGRRHSAKCRVSSSRSNASKIFAYEDPWSWLEVALQRPS